MGLMNAGSSVVAAAALIHSANKARTATVGKTEERAFRFFNDAPDEAHTAAWIVMQAGSLGSVFVVSLALACAGRGRRSAVSLVAGTAVWSVVKLIKPLVGRGRPPAHLGTVSIRGRPQSGLGYPSGHAAVAMTLALVASGDRATTERVVAIAVAGITGVSRMYVGAHLPLDVAGGSAIGVLSGQAANIVLEALDAR